MVFRTVQFYVCDTDDEETGQLTNFFEKKNYKLQK